MCRKILCALIICVASLSACKKDKDITPAVTPPVDTTQPPVDTSTVTYPARDELNISYGSHAFQKMDVHFPEDYSNKTPVVFLIHGGGFIAGLKEDFTDKAKLFRNKGFIIVNISHRLVDTTGALKTPPDRRDSDIKIKDELDDVHASVLKYREMSASWKSGTGRMYMAGHSAGAVLSMLYTLGDYNNDNHIRACGNWAGFTDISIPHDSLLKYYDARILEIFHRMTGAEPKTANNLFYMAVSPYWVANLKGGAPTISIYPQNNTVLNVPGEAEGSLQLTQSYHTLLKNKGVTEKLSVYPNTDHGFGPPGSWEKLIAETTDFFNSL